MVCIYGFGAGGVVIVLEGSADIEHVFKAVAPYENWHVRVIENNSDNEMEVDDSTHAGCGCGCGENGVECTCSHSHSHSHSSSNFHSHNNELRNSSSPSRSPSPSSSPNSTPPHSPTQTNMDSSSISRITVKTENSANNFKFDGECLDLGRLEGEGEEEYIVRNCINVSSTHSKLRHVVFLSSPQTNPSLITKLEEHKVFYFYFILFFCYFLHSVFE